MLLVAVRGRLLHADQGKELLTTSNVFAVCLLSADCRHPRKSTWHAPANARTKWLLRKKHIHNYTAWPAQERRYGEHSHKCVKYNQLFSCMHDCTRTHTYALTHTWSPGDEEYLIKTPDSSKPFAATLCCRKKKKKRDYFLWKIQQVCDELWELKPIWSHAPLWHLWGSAKSYISTSD